MRDCSKRVGPLNHPATHARLSIDSHSCADILALPGGPCGSLWEITLMYIHKYYFIEAGDLIFNYFLVVFNYNLFFVFNLLITTYLQIILIFKVYNNSKLKSKLSNLIRSSELISSISCSAVPGFSVLCS